MIGQRLGSFQIESKIGSGAMGEVYLATQVLKDGRTRKSAVKVVSGDFLQKENALRRFEREAQILAQLRHPNIVRYYAHGRYKGTYYYAMEFVDGETLDDLIERREFLPWQDTVALGIQLCHALQYAHDHQVVHRDLKPSNLMITRDLRLKLTDFGIAKDLEATVALTRTGRTLGTAAYMAPEQIRGTPEISHKTDLYALGCLLFQMLTGRPPFEGKSAVVLMHSHMSETPPRPSDKVPDIPKVLDDLVVRLMSKDPPDRPWDAAQVAHILEQLRDRADRGEPIPMVFDKVRAEIAASGGVAAPPRLSRKTRAKSKRSAQARDSRAGSIRDRLPTITRHHVETGLLVLALLAMLGFAGYMLMPPSQEYLYREASELMASDRRADQRRAIREYVEPLERRFPNHPYQKQVREWRVQLALMDVQERADALMSAHPRFNQPEGPIEELYQETARTEATLEPLDQHAKIADLWRHFVETVDQASSPSPERIAWRMLGQNKLESHQDALNRQRAAAMQLFQDAEAQRIAGNTERARVLLNQILSGFTSAAQGDPQGLGLLISRAEAALATLDQAPAPPEAEGHAEATDELSPDTTEPIPTPPRSASPSGTEDAPTNDVPVNTGKPENFPSSSSTDSVSEPSSGEGR